MSDFIQGIFMLCAGLGIIFFASKFDADSDWWRGDKAKYLSCISLSMGVEKSLSIKLNVDEESWIINDGESFIWESGSVQPHLSEHQLTVTDNTISLDEESEVLLYDCLDCGAVKIEKSWLLNRVTRRLSYTEVGGEKRLSEVYQCEEVNLL